MYTNRHPWTVTRANASVYTRTHTRTPQRWYIQTRTLTTEGAKSQFTTSVNPNRKSSNLSSPLTIDEFAVVYQTNPLKRKFEQKSYVCVLIDGKVRWGRWVRLRACQLTQGNPEIRYLAVDERFHVHFAQRAERSTRLLVQAFVPSCIICVCVTQVVQRLCQPRSTC
jgi:hypothetical protein